MKILNIKIKDYGSYKGEHNISLDNRGLVLIEGINHDEFKMDSNGSGKSQIPDSLDWCITGVIPRGDHIDSIINDTSKTCSVSVFIESDTGDIIHIQRERNRGKNTKLDLFVNSEKLTTLDVKETQKIIYRLLGIDRDILHSTVLFAQTDLVHYADSSDKVRMEILTKLLQLENIDELLEKTKIEVKGLNDKHEKVLWNIESKQAEIQQLKVKDYDYEIQQWEDKRGLDVTELQQLYASKYKEYSEIGGMYQNLTPIHNEINELKKQIKPVIREDKLLQEAIKLQRDLESQVYLGKKELEITQKEYLRIDSKIQHSDLVCDKCGQAISRDKLYSELQLLGDKEQQQGELVSGLEERLNKAIIQANKEQAKVDQNINEIGYFNQNIQNQINEKQKALFQIEAQVDQKNKLESEVQRLGVLIENKQNEINPWIQVKQNELIKIGELEKQLTKLNDQLTSIQQLKGYYDFWVRGFGVKGLKSYILDSKLQELNDSINYWVRVLTGGTIWVELGSHKTNRSNKVVNSPDIKVCRWNPDGTIISRNYNSWSGGEKQRVSLAIDFGMSSLIARRSKYNYSIVFLDEVFKHLDRGGKESVMEMLQLLAKEKSSVFVVEHDSEFKSLFDTKICVEKRNGVSNILEINNGSQEKEKSTPVPFTAVRKRIPIK